MNKLVQTVTPSHVKSKSVRITIRDHGPKLLGRKNHIRRNHSHISNNHVYIIGMLSSFRECGKVPPELAVLPPEDIRDQEFGEERRQWREPCARRDMADDVRQQENILSSCEYRVEWAQ